MTTGVLTVVGSTASADEIATIRRNCYLPGEAVRSVSKGPTRLIEKTLVRFGDSGPGGRTFEVTYVFEGDASEHEARLYEDACGSTHHYGAVAMRGGRMWLIPMDGDRIPKGKTVEIVGVRGRFIGGDEPPGKTFGYLMEEAGLASEGEFVIHPTEDGNYDRALLGGIPWWGRADLQTTALAQAAAVKAESESGDDPRNGRCGPEG